MARRPNSNHSLSPRQTNRTCSRSSSRSYLSSAFGFFIILFFLYKHPSRQKTLHWKVKISNPIPLKKIPVSFRLPTTIVYATPPLSPTTSYHSHESVNSHVPPEAYVPKKKPLQLFRDYSENFPPKRFPIQLRY